MLFSIRFKITLREAEVLEIFHGYRYVCLLRNISHDVGVGDLKTWLLRLLWHENHNELQENCAADQKVSAGQTYIARTEWCSSLYYKICLGFINIQEMSGFVVTVFFRELGCNSNSGSGGCLNTQGIKTRSLETEIFTYFRIKCLWLLNKSQNQFKILACHLKYRYC
jgi:hypothetical protein